jgi:hypothetical protein
MWKWKQKKDKGGKKREKKGTTHALPTKDEEWHKKITSHDKKYIKNISICSI